MTDFFYFHSLLALSSGQVYDLLCESFVCGLDAIHWRNETGSLPMDIYRKFTQLKPFYFLELYKELRSAPACTLSAPWFSTWVHPRVPPCLAAFSLS